MPFLTCTHSHLGHIYIRCHTYIHIIIIYNYIGIPLLPMLQLYTELYDMVEIISSEFPYIMPSLWYLILHVFITHYWGLIIYFTIYKSLKCTFEYWLYNPCYWLSCFVMKPYWNFVIIMSQSCATLSICREVTLINLI